MITLYLKYLSISATCYLWSPPLSCLILNVVRSMHCVSSPGIFVNTLKLYSRQKNVNNYPRQFIFVAPGDTLYFSRFVHSNYFCYYAIGDLLFAIRLSYYAICYRTAYLMIMLGDLVGLNSQFIFVAPGDTL